MVFFSFCNVFCDYDVCIAVRLGFMSCSVMVSVLVFIFSVYLSVVECDLLLDSVLVLMFAVYLSVVECDLFLESGSVFV